MTMPVRVRLSRRAGWRKPPNTRVVSRPSRYGNPITIAMLRVDWPQATDRHLRAMAVSDFRGNLSGRFESDDWVYPSVDDIISDLAGRNLACWCPLDEPCHADVLLQIANGVPVEEWGRHRLGLLG